MSTPKETSKKLKKLRQDARRDTAHALRVAGQPLGPRHRAQEQLFDMVEQSLKDEVRENVPKGPKGQKRPTDVIGNAIKVARIATGEEEETLTGDGKDKAAVSLGKRGGAARAKALTQKERSAIAKKAARTRWSRES